MLEGCSRSPDLEVILSQVILLDLVQLGSELGGVPFVVVAQVRFG